MRTKFNGRAFRSIVLATLLGVVGTAALDLFFATYEEHTCCGEGCPVCAQNQSRPGGLGYLAPSLAVFSTRVLLAYLPKPSDFRGVSTLVEAKVRLNE